MASILTSSGEVKPIFVSTSQTPSKFTFTVDRDVHFNTIIRDGRRVKQPGQASNIVNTIEKDGKIIGTVDRLENAIAECAQETLTSMLANFIKFSDTATNGCFGGNGKFAEPLEPNTVIKERASAKVVTTDTFHYFDLFSQEIKDLILNEVVDPHTVTVYRGERKYVINMDRKWADIALYHVCREFRQHAIRKFGVPKQHRSFPFDPENDVLYLRTYSNYRLAQLLRMGGRKRPVFEVREYPSHALDIDYEVWDRIRTVESEARMPQEIGWRVLLGMPLIFRNIETWRVLVVQLDTCNDADNLGTQALFQSSDHGILRGVIGCLSSDIYWKPKFIEICRRGCMCSKANRLTWKNTRNLPGRGEISIIKMDNMDGLLDRTW